MIYLNLLNRIFGPKDPLSRKEIDEIRSNSASIETEHKAESDVFNASSIDGWSTLESDVNTSMKGVDERMNNYLNQHSSATNTKGIYLFLGLFTVSMLVLVFYTYQGNQLAKKSIVGNSESKSENKNIVIENLSPKEQVDEKIAEIDNYTAIDKKEQITKEQLRSETDPKAPELSNMNNDTENSVDQNKVERLHPKKIQSIPTEGTSGLSYTTVIEVYLNGLKTVDYRSIREEEPLTLLQELPIGTPANKAGRNDNAPLETETLSKKVDYIDYIEETQRLFSKENFKKALRRYLIILDHYPDDVNAHFYSGLCYYNLGKYEEAENHFNNSYSLKIGNFKQEAEWFRSKALIKSNQIDSAKEVLKKIVEEKGFYSEQAAELLNSL